MIYFLYGEDSYRLKEKLDEIILGYKKIHKSGLNLIKADAKEIDFKDFFMNLKINSMFDEKKLIILKNVFNSLKFQEEFLKEIKKIEETKDIIVVYEEQKADQRTKFFKVLEKTAKCQEFKSLQGVALRKWLKQKSDKVGAKINPDAEELILSFVGNNLWQITNEIKKLSDYKKGSVIKKEDVELLIKPNVENDIFKTIDALASKDKKKALSLLHKHIDNGDVPLYLLSMIAYQFRNLLIIKELQEMQKPYAMIAKSCGLHPFVVQKSYYLCNQFSIEQLKKIYQRIFQVDSDIKTGKIEAETALDLLVSEI
jgi:DNA polymerase-3 subunit delta